MIDLFATGLYLRLPGGNVENPDAQKLVAKWAALNVGGDVGRDPARWDRQRSVYRAAGIPYFPWLHCRTVEDAEWLIGVASDWAAEGAAKVIGLNVEDVAGDRLSLRALGGTVLDFWVNAEGGQVHLPTLPWVQNEQGWGHLDYAVFALEIFPDEQTNIYPGGVHSPATTDQCISHAFAEGAKKVTLMLKTKAPNTRESYGPSFSYCHSLYTEDDIGHTAEAHRAWTLDGACARPRKEEPVPPDPEDQRWYRRPYPKGKAVGPAELPRALYPLDAAPGRKPSRDGPDVLAWKRGIKRGQRWALLRTFAQLDDTFSNGFSHGTSPNVRDSGVAGFQRQEGIQPTGWVGNGTYQAARRSLVPIGPNEGKPLFDDEAVELLFKASKIDWTPTIEIPRIEPIQGWESLAKPLHVLFSIGRSMGLTDAGTYNPASTLPSGADSDHSVFPARAFDLYIEPDTGFANPVGREFFEIAEKDPACEYVILGNVIADDGGRHTYTHGGHGNHVHVSGRR